VSGAVRTGLPESHARFFQDSASAASFLDEEIRKGDLALVKGSRGVHTEKLIQSLRSKFKLLETMQ
jgi:UDP-N-acetylmuramyl pentapeptide synthase